MSTVPSGTRFIGISERVNLTERKSAGLNSETQPYTIDDLVDTIGVGAEGPQGVEGPAGPPGPVGPAGLEWQGAWVSGTSYVANDAVGYGGASYFCILATSGTTTPNLATANWALLASQGAIGPQGAQGPTGPQGAGATQTLEQTVGLGNTITDGYNTMTVTANSIKTNTSLGGQAELVGSTGPSAKPFLKFGLSASAGKTVTLTHADTQSASRTIKLPDASGTVALTNTITLQQTFDNGGNNITSGNFKTTLQSTGIISENTVSLSKIEIIPTQIKLIRSNGGLQQTNLYCSLTPTANRNIYLPDASGTVALTSDIVSQYKECSFKLSQSGTNAPAKYNSFIDQISVGSSPSDPLFRTTYFDYVSPGVYEIGWIWLTGSASQISAPKLDFSVSSGRIEVTAETNFSTGPYSGYKFTIGVRDSSGALANNALGFVNAYFRLFN